MLFDQPDAFHRLDRAADIILIAGRARENQRVKNDVFRLDSVFLRQQLVRAKRDLELPLARERLRLHRILVDASHYDCRAKFMRNRRDALEFFFAVFQVDRVDDGFALAVGQRLRHRRRIRRVHHDRNFHLADQLLVKGWNVVLLVALRALQADVHDLRAAAHLPPRDLARFLPFFFGHKLLEQPRPDYVRSLAHQQRSRAFLGLDHLDAGIHGSVLRRGLLPGTLAFGHLRDCTNVFLRRPAAATDNVQPAVVDEFLELRSQRLRCLQVLGCFRVGKTRIGVAGHKFARELVQGPDMVGHELRPSPAVHPESQGMRVPQRGPHRLDVLSREHRAHRLDGHRNHQGDLRAQFPRKFLNRKDSRFDIPRILARLHQQQVRAAFNQAACLHVERLAQALERHPTGNRDGLRRRPHRAGDKARFCRRRSGICRLPRQFGGASVQFERVRGEAVFAQHNRRASE